MQSSFAKQEDLEIVKAELKLVKWMVGGIGFGIILLIVENLFLS